MSSEFRLDIDAGNTATAPVLTRPATGKIAVGLIFTGKAMTTAGLSVTNFTSDAGASLPVTIVDCANRTDVGPPSNVGPPSPSMSVTPNTVTTICLAVPSMPLAAKFTGQIIVTAPDHEPFVRSITVAPPIVPSGTLVLDHLTVVKTVDRSFWRPASSGQLQTYVTLREKSGAIPLEGIAVRLEQVMAPPGGFDLKNNVKFEVNGRDANLASFVPTVMTPTNNAEPNPSQRLPAGGQSDVGIILQNLEAGDYAVTLHFVANNSTDDPSQRLQLNIHVRDSVMWAIGCLIIALIISFVATKILTSERRRAAILQQIESMRPAWLAALPPVPAVVWAQAVLHKAKRLTRGFVLTSPELIEASVTSVTTVLGVLDAARQLQRRLSLVLDKMVLKRVALNIERILSRIDAGPQDEAAIQGLKSEFSAFEDWLSTDKFPGVFWSDIVSDLRNLQSEIVDAQVPQVAQEVMAELKGAISTALMNPPTTRDDVVSVYKKYAGLRVLWDLGQDVSDELVGFARNDLHRLLDEFDNRMWQQLKKESTVLTIRMPVSNDPDGLEAYDTLQFSIETPDVEVSHSYLFRHKIECRWTFTLQPEPTRFERLGLRRLPAAVVLRPVSIGRSIVQYFPRAGRLRVEATIAYGDGELRKLSPVDGPEIRKSSDYAVYKILAGTETVSWILAGIVAIATGLSTYYFKGTSWGTFQDYLTMFLWGVGVDQGKNFVQALQQFGSSPPTATAAH